MRDSYCYAPVISPDLLAKAEKKLLQFREASERYLNNLQIQIDFSKSDAYQNKLKNAKMFTSHFLIVLGMCVKRGEIRPSELLYYSLSEDSSDMPDLSSDISVLRWSENVIKGEKLRIDNRGIPIYNPTIAKVIVHYDLFKEQYQKQCMLRQSTEESLTVVSLLRPQIDEVILEVWNSIESYFDDLHGESKIDKCKEYGLIYYYRKGEKSD
jgi:hypothetical protein